MFDPILSEHDIVQAFKVFMIPALFLAFLWLMQFFPDLVRGKRK